MASSQPYWVEKELKTYNSAYRVWFQLGIADHVTIAEMFTSETSAYQGLLVILEQAVSLLSVRDLLVRLHLMICFFPFSIKTYNSVKKKRKKTLLVLINLARVIENGPIFAKGSGNDNWTSIWVCGHVRGGYWRVCVLVTYCGSGSFVFIVIYTSYAVWNGRTVNDILNLVSKDIKIFPKC